MTGLVVLNRGSGDGRRHAAVARWAASRGMGVRHVDSGLAAAVDAAVSDGADLLVAAGGDGTVGCVAGEAVRVGLPMAVAPIGTRNHFARDVGLPVDDPVSTLDAAVRAGVERRVDVGEVNGRVFVNNISLGLYARAVRDPDYRRGRAMTLASYVRRAARGHGRRATIHLDLPGHVPPNPRVGAVLVSNNAYDFLASGAGRHRPSLERGELWVYLVGLPKVPGPFPLVRALGEVLSTGQVSAGGWPVREETITTDGPVPVAVDGEAYDDIHPPYRLRCRPQALRLRVPEPAPPGRTVRLRW